MADPAPDARQDPGSRDPGDRQADEKQDEARREGVGLNKKHFGQAKEELVLKDIQTDKENRQERRDDPERNADADAQMEEDEGLTGLQMFLLTRFSTIIPF